MPSCASGPNPIRSGSRDGSRCSATPIPRRSRRSRSTSSARCSCATWRSAPTPASSRRRPTVSPTWPTWTGPRERAEVPADLPEQPVARRVPPPLDVPEAPLPHPPFTLVTDRRRAGAAVRATRAGGRAGGRHRDRLRPARCARRLVSGRRRGAPAAGGGARRRRDRVRRGRLLRGRAAAARAAARRRARDHRAQRALRAGLADVPLRPAGLALGLRHELRVPRLRAPLVDPGSGLRAPRRHALDRDPPPAGRAQGRPRRRLVGRRAARARAARLRRLRRRRAAGAARPRLRPGRGVRLHRAGAGSLPHGLRRGLPAAAAAPPRCRGGGHRADRRRRGRCGPGRGRRRHPAPAAVGVQARRPARALRAAPRWPGRPRRPDLLYDRSRTSARASTAQAARQSSSDALSAGLCEMPVGLRTNSIAAGRCRASTPASCPA